MTYASALSAFSTIVDVAGAKNALMDHALWQKQPDTVSIWAEAEGDGDLRLTNTRSKNHPDFELEWEVGTIPLAIEPGEPALESSRRLLSGMTTAEIIETIFGKPIQSRSRRESAVEHWHAILAEGNGSIFIAGPIDNRILRALVRNEPSERGQLFVIEVPQANDFRVIWSSNIDARARLPENEQEDVTDLSTAGAIDHISRAMKAD